MASRRACRSLGLGCLRAGAAGSRRYWRDLGALFLAARGVSPLSPALRVLCCQQALPALAVHAVKWCWLHVGMCFWVASN